MISIFDQRPRSPERCVHAARNAYSEPLNTASELFARIRLADQMHVIMLDRILNNPKPRPCTREPERILNSRKNPRAPQIAPPATNLQRHERWRMPCHFLACAMPNSGPAVLGLSAGAFSFSAPEFEAELELTTHDLERALIV